MKKTMIIVLIVVIVLLVGISTFFIAQFTFSHDETDSGKPKVGPIMETEEFTVNLSASMSHFVKAKFAIELSNSKVQAELEEKMPLVKDTIIMVLSGQSLENLGTVEGKEKLKDTLIKALNNFLEKGQVTNIYYLNIIFS